MLDPITRRQLLTQGLTVRGIAAAVHRGDLIRARRGWYLPRVAPPALVGATRVGGRLACVSELRARGVWVVDDGRLHVHLAANASRLRDPADRTVPFTPQSGSRLHWRDLADAEHASAGHVSVVDALLQASRCLSRRHLQASLDSAFRQGLVRRRAALERDRIVGPLLRRVDSSAASGIETIVRELVRDLGLRVETQVPLDRVGFVDLIVEGRIAIEVDGTAFHSGEAIARDYRRDAAVAASGRVPLRFSYAQVVYDLPTVAHAVIGAVMRHRGVRNSGQKGRRALRRAASIDLA